MTMPGAVRTTAADMTIQHRHGKGGKAFTDSHAAVTSIRQA